jgi:hypothetical protein
LQDPLVSSGQAPSGEPPGTATTDILIKEMVTISNASHEAEVEKLMGELGKDPYDEDQVNDQHFNFILPGVFSCYYMVTS